MTEIDDLRRAIGIHAAAHVLLIAALLTPPSKLTHRQLAFVFLPLIWGCHFYTVTSILAQAVALHALWSTELLLFRNPREDFAIKHYGVSPKTLVKEKIDEFSTPNEKREVAWTEPYPEKPWRRISWVFSLLISFRYVGWATSPSSAQQWNSHTPTPKAQSRVFFIIRKFVLAVACMIITDFTNLYQYYDPYMRFESSIDSTFPRRLRDILAGYHISSISPRLVRISMLGLQQWCTYSLLGAAPAVVFVTLGGLGAVGDFWGRPENWPGVMGSPMVVAKRGLRGFWGGFWHQLFRNVSTLHRMKNSLLMRIQDATQPQPRGHKFPQSPKIFHTMLRPPSSPRLPPLRHPTSNNSPTPHSRHQFPRLHKVHVDPGHLCAFGSRG